MYIVLFRLCYEVYISLTLVKKYCVSVQRTIFKSNVQCMLLGSICKGVPKARVNMYKDIGCYPS